MHNFSRRTALKLFSSSALAALGGVPAVRAQSSLAEPIDRMKLPLVTALPPGEKLVAGPALYNFKPGSEQHGLGYNGLGPGPLITVQRGDIFVQDVENGHNQPTTWHWHGLIAPPDMDGHPADELAPGMGKHVSFPIIQRAGLNWYHSHAHGQTSQQVWYGLAGLFVIEDEEEKALKLPKGERERILVLRDAQLGPDGDLVFQTVAGGFLGDFPVINGVAWPKTTLPNKLVRLRLLNGSNARVFRLTSDAPMTIIGNDGGLIDRPQQVNLIEMAPAERLDLIVDLRGFRVGETVGIDCVSANWRLLDIEVTNAQEDEEQDSWEIPETLSVIDTLSHDGEPDQVFVFQQDTTINDRLYNINLTDFVVPFGKTQRWRLSTARGAPHPIHVHGAHFQIVNRDGGFRDAVQPWERGWKDTVLLMPHEVVDILVRFDHYEGRYLLHCHKLAHEDHGMMMNFIVSREPQKAAARAEAERLWGPLCAPPAA